MTEDEKMEFVIVLTQIMDLCEERFKLDPGDAVMEGENSVLLEMPWFMITAIDREEPPRFLVSFSTSAGTIIAAETIKTIAFVLKPIEYNIGEQYLIDSENVLFGEEAIEKHEEIVMENHGKVKCPACEQYHFINNLDDSGLCPECLFLLSQPGTWS